MSELLTPKQEKFCRCIVSGMSAKDSYMESYNSKSESAAMVEGMKLLKREDVTERIKQLSQPIETLAQTKALSEREKKRAIIWERIQYCIDTGNDNAIARYMDILNKMDSEYININRNIDDTTEKLDHLDVDALKTLVNAQKE